MADVLELKADLWPKGAQPPTGPMEAEAASAGFYAQR